MARQMYGKSGLLLCAAVLFIVQGAFGGIIYVDAGAVGSNNGSSWENAFNSLQDGLAVGGNGDEIHVAAGIYRPDVGDGYTSGDREASFVLKNGVNILGGFPAGGGERDAEVNLTILSGDLLGDDEPSTVTADLLTDETRGENSYHVIVGQFCGPLTVLDGLIVTAGQANGAEDDYYARGGGWLNTTNSSPTVSNCIFEKNAARLSGGGLYNKGIACRPPITECEFRDNYSGLDGGGITSKSNSLDWVISNCVFSGNVAYHYGGGMIFASSSPTIEDCQFVQNGADWGGGLYTHEGCNIILRNCVLEENTATDSGGGLYNSNNTSTVDSCEFVNNRAGTYGGAIYSNSSHLDISDTLFWYNVSTSSGGGIHNYHSSPVVVDCRFLANETEKSSGGAITNRRNSNPRFYNCIFSFNKAIEGSGGAIFNWAESSSYPDPRFYNCTLSWNSALSSGGGIYSSHSTNDTYLTNCILWGNVDTNGSKQDLSAQISKSTYHVNYSCIQGYDTSKGVGNINSDPMLVDPAGEDWMYGTLDDDLRLQAGSPCIDAGDSTALPVDITTDLDGFSRFIDMPQVDNTGVVSEPNLWVDMGAYEKQKCPITDANLKAAVEEQLGVSDPTCDEIAALTELEANNAGIVELTGLECAVNLESLSLHSNQITDIGPIAGLENLTFVHLANNEIAELPDISSWTNIRYLYLYNNKISDIVPLTSSAIATLGNLYIYSNEVLPMEAYRDHIPAIKANNPGVDLRYDHGCDPLLVGDFNMDCRVDFADLAELASNWLECTHMYEELCQ